MRDRKSFGCYAEKSRAICWKGISVRDGLNYAEIEEDLHVEIGRTQGHPCRNERRMGKVGNPRFPRCGHCVDTQGLLKSVGVLRDDNQMG